MSEFTLTTTINRPYADAVTAVREAVADQGFGVLTEIDLVEAFDPDAMMGLAGTPALDKIASDATERLGAAFATLATL